MSTLSTHVLDTSLGLPAEGVAVTLTDSAGQQLGAAVTDDDGRVKGLGPDSLAVGTYALRFEVADYFAASGRPSFYPEVSVVFTLAEERHHHVPLLLSPFGYSTYRGS